VTSLREWRPPVTDLVIGGLLFVFTVWEEYDGSDHVSAHHLGQNLVAALVTLPVLWRQRWPVLTYLVSTAAFGGKALVFHPMSSPLGEPLALAVLLYTVSARLRLRSTVLLLAYAFCFGYLRSVGSPSYGVAGNIVNELFLLLPWGIGRLVHALEDRATTSEQRVAVVADWAAESSREAVAEERLRIARELHDIVAHSIGVIHLHAGGGKRMLDHDLGQARLAFETIERAAGDALAETRRLLNVLQPEHDVREPQPTLEDLPALAERIRAAGVAVDLDVDEPGELSPGLSLCLYRIVQEATTNAVRHGHARRIDVRLHDDDAGLVLHVSDDGVEATGASQGGGHGITGMRQRVAMFGGTLRVGPRSEGGFTVHATFPREDA
jgi:signal transduction histidine kinase